MSMLVRHGGTAPAAQVRTVQQLIESGERIREVEDDVEPVIAQVVGAQVHARVHLRRPWSLAAVAPSRVADL